MAQLLRTGKVRDLYDIGKNLMLIRHSDRVSSFDKVWCDIRDKGNILNSSSVWWFDRTKHIVPNHLVYSPENGKDMIVRKCTVFPIEFVVRGYITGSTNTSLWTHYNRGKRTYCGLHFPDGLKKNQRLFKPVITPTTKGDIDEPISAEEIVSREIMTQSEWDYCSQKAMELYKYGQKIAKGSGLILVDTKYEFGRNMKTGEIMLIDEIHTCDSSRFWKLDTYDARFQSGMEPEKFDKDLVRTYVKTQCEPYSTKPSDVTIPQDIKNTVRKAYLEFYNVLTGTLLELSESETPTPTDVAVHYFERYHRDRVYIISGSVNDKSFVERIQSHLDKLGLYHTWLACSAHKQTRKVIEYLEQRESEAQTHNHRVVYITVAGRSNALSGVVACNTRFPVIACPPFKDKIDMMVNINSTLQMPSNTPVITVIDPGNAALATDRMFKL